MRYGTGSLLPGVSVVVVLLQTVRQKSRLSNYGDCFVIGAEAFNSDIIAITSQRTSPRNELKL
jgi:hypothetical protein